MIIGVCFLFFLLGLPYFASGGYYLFLLMDNSVVSTNAIIIALLQVVLVGWVFGANNFLDCISKMEMKLSTITQWYLKICIKFVCPASLSFVLLHTMSTLITEYPYTQYTFKADPCPDVLYVKSDDDGNCIYELKDAESLTWLIQIFILSFIPIFGGYVAFCTTKRLLLPTKKWKPVDECTTENFAMQ